MFSSSALFLRLFLMPMCQLPFVFHVLFSPTSLPFPPVPPSPPLPPLPSPSPLPLSPRTLTFPAVLSGEIERTAAVVAVHQIHAGGTRRTAAGLAVVDVGLTVDPCVARRTLALIAGSLVHTCGTVLAELRQWTCSTCVSGHVELEMFRWHSNLDWWKT